MELGVLTRISFVLYILWLPEKNGSSSIYFSTHLRQSSAILKILQVSMKIQKLFLWLNRPSTSYANKGTWPNPFVREIEFIIVFTSIRNRLKNNFLLNFLNSFIHKQNLIYWFPFENSNSYRKQPRYVPMYVQR